MAVPRIADFKKDNYSPLTQVQGYGTRKCKQDNICIQCNLAGYPWRFVIMNFNMFSLYLKLM